LELVEGLPRKEELDEIIARLERIKELKAEVL
jgi:hypothetical protein